MGETVAVLPVFNWYICDAVRVHLHQASAVTLALTLERNTFVSIAPCTPSIIISINNTSVIRMHSSGMRTARLLTVSCSARGGGRGLPGGVPCDLSHNAFDVTCMLALHQLRLNSNAAAYIVLVMWPLKECWDTPYPLPPSHTHTQNSILDTRLWKHYPLSSRNYCCRR